MTRGRRIAVWLLLAGVLAGCRKEAPKPKPKRAGLVVLERGQAPRQRLRYRFQRGVTLYYRLVTEQRRTHVADAGIRRVVGLSYYVDRVKGPRAQVRWRVEPLPGVKRKRHRGETVWLQLHESGRVEATRVPGASVDRASALKPLLRGLASRWPGTDVGVGARWRDRRKVRMPLRAGARRSALTTEVETLYRFDRRGPCGRSQCAFIGLRITLWTEHKHRQATFFGTGKGKGEITFDLTRGQLVSIRTRSDFKLKAELHKGQPLEAIRLVQELTPQRNPGRSK